MRLQSHDSAISTPTSTPESPAVLVPRDPSGGVSARDLKELLAVIIGVCESLADNLKDSPNHAELARIGALAADRAAGLTAELAQHEAIAGEGAAPVRLPANANGRRVLLVED